MSINIRSDFNQLHQRATQTFHILGLEADVYFLYLKNDPAGASEQYLWHGTIRTDISPPLKTESDGSNRFWLSPATLEAAANYLATVIHAPLFFAPPIMESHLTVYLMVGAPDFVLRDSPYRYLMDAALHVIIGEFQSSMDRLMSIRPVEILAYEAGDLMVKTLLSQDSGSDCFELLNRIALQSYENATTSGVLVFCSPDHPAVDLSIRFQTPVVMDDIVYMRKLLQLTDDRHYLLVDGKNAFGLGQLSGAVPDLMQVVFKKQGSWHWRYGDAPVMSVNYRLPAFPQYDVREAKFRQVLSTVFPEVTRIQPDHLWLLIKTAVQQVRGTNILISADAAAAAQRLQVQATLVHPFRLEGDAVKQVTSIDGTLVIDTMGVCYALGAILDGPVSNAGTGARGGRYNSAVMYTGHATTPCLIVVVSESGTLDFVFRQPHPDRI